MLWIKSMVSRVFFIVAFVLLGSALSEKVADLFGLPGLSQYPPSRLLFYAVTSLLFVIALELRDIKYLLNAQLVKERVEMPATANRRTSAILTLVSVVFVIFAITING